MHTGRDILYSILCSCCRGATNKYLPNKTDCFCTYVDRYYSRKSNKERELKKKKRWQINIHCGGFSQHPQCIRQQVQDSKSQYYITFTCSLDHNLRQVTQCTMSAMKKKRATFCKWMWTDCNISIPQSNQ